MTAVDKWNALTFRRTCGDDFVIAPVIDAIEAADPGIYQLSDEDEIVEDPDFTALLTVRSPCRS